ncbi:MAG TPA: DinB family protein [Rectinemataceae bacterium]|nr:DinB family protein [Rectinemataceae bacterium]
MTRAEKLDLISKFESSYDLVEELISGMSDEALRFAPPIPDAWSIHDFLVHFLDADNSLCFRVRGAIAEPGIEAPVWDEDRWHANLHYEAEDGRRCLELAKGLRRFLAASLRSLVDDDWSGYFFNHPTRGRMDLEAVLAMYREHVAFHVSLIKRNREAWKAD